MPILMDFTIARFEDGILSVSMSPQVNVAGWNIRFTTSKRFGGLSGLVTKSAASGYGGGVSGVTVTNSGLGVFQVALNSADMSGQEYGAYSYAIERLDSGNRTVLTQGNLLLMPGV